MRWSPAPCSYPTRLLGGWHLPPGRGTFGWSRPLRPAMIGHGQPALRRIRAQHLDLERGCPLVCCDWRGHDAGFPRANADGRERDGRRQPLDILDGVAVSSGAVGQSLHEQSHDDGPPGEWDDVRPASPSSQEPTNRLLLRVPDGEHTGNGQRKPPRRSSRASGRRRSGFPLLPGLPGLCPDVPPTHPLCDQQGYPPPMGRHSVPGRSLGLERLPRPLQQGPRCRFDWTLPGCIVAHRPHQTRGRPQPHRTSVARLGASDGRQCDCADRSKRRRRLHPHTGLPDRHSDEVRPGLLVVQLAATR